MLIKVPHYVYVNDDKLSLCISYKDDEEKGGYCWSISYFDLAHDYTFRSKSLIEVQYQALDWIRKEKIQYE